ncbi:MAG: tol-pal system YbgF family protein, partial [Gemmatimonadota bacterium]
MRTRKRLPGARVTKRQLKRDRFVDTVFDWALWSRENARTVAVICGALVVVIGGLLLYRTSRAGENRRAAERYQEVWQAYAAGNYQLAANDFRQFRNQYAGSDYVDEATAYLGDSYYQAGDYPAAIEVLKGFDDDHGDSPLVFAAASVLGAAYEASGDWVNAADAYRKAQELARYDYQRAEALLNEARVLEAGGEPERAADAY